MNPSRIRGRVPKTMMKKWTLCFLIFFLYFTTEQTPVSPSCQGMECDSSVVFLFFPSIDGYAQGDPISTLTDDTGHGYLAQCHNGQTCATKTTSPIPGRDAVRSEGKERKTHYHIQPQGSSDLAFTSFTMRACGMAEARTMGTNQKPLLFSQTNPAEVRYLLKGFRADDDVFASYDYKMAFTYEPCYTCAKQEVTVTGFMYNEWYCFYGTYDANSASPTYRQQRFYADLPSICGSKTLCLVGSRTATADPGLVNGIYTLMNYYSLTASGEDDPWFGPANSFLIANRPWSDVEIQNDYAALTGVGGSCGNAVCDAGETCSTCIDCACQNGETCSNDVCIDCDIDNDGFSGSACGGNDCNDANAVIHPGATDVCGDGIDQDCSGSDSSCLCGDGNLGIGEQCDDGNVQNNDGCHSDCTLEVCGNNRKEGSETCDGSDATACPGLCQSSCTCGSSCGNALCESSESPLTCPQDCGTCGNGICDSGETSSTCLADCPCIDQDGDGYATTSFCSPNPDCDDTDSSIHPGATEVCDSLDNSCDGVIDEGCSCTSGTTQTCGTDVGACQKGIQICVNGQWDTVCQGEIGPTTEVCGNGVDEDCTGQDLSCSPACQDVDQDGFFAVDVACPSGNDCQDANALVNPGTTDLCGNNIDEDCSGADQTCSTSVMCTDGQVRSCGPGVGECSTGTQLCSGGEWSVCSGAVLPRTEICDQKDNDCDGEVDETTCLCQQGDRKACGSNIGACREGVRVCDNQGNWGTCTGGIHAVDIDMCGNQIDDDCNGIVDDRCEEAVNTCSNEILDVNEEGVDCGGACSHACPTTQEVNINGIVAVTVLLIAIVAVLLPHHTILGK